MGTLPLPFQSTPPRGGRHVYERHAEANYRVSIHAPEKVRHLFKAVSIHAPGPEEHQVNPSRFNPRPRAGGDAMAASTTALTVLFQSTPPRGGRLQTRSYHKGGRYVSIHAPARGATKGAQGGSYVGKVSIHAPARGATAVFAAERLFDKFQSTPPRGGRRGARVPFPRRRRVSIHAPARGATCHRTHSKDGVDVSIHAPARGATLLVWGDTPGYTFQSTPPRGGRRPTATGTALPIMFQSTPPRGGRHTVAGHSQAGQNCFNPRPRAGGDSHGRNASPSSGTFQSTPPRGGRHKHEDGRRRFPRFNPRPRAGGDHGSGPAPSQKECFNPRPRAGGDFQLEHDEGHEVVSIHAPARGATQLQVRMEVEGRFNPRPRAGGDRVIANRDMPGSMFQSTPPRGGRLQALLQGNRSTIVSIHAPARGATCRRHRTPRRSHVSIHAPARGATRRRS